MDLDKDTAVTARITRRRSPDPTVLTRARQMPYWRAPIPINMLFLTHYMVHTHTIGQPWAHSGLRPVNIRDLIFIKWC